MESIDTGTDCLRATLHQGVATLTLNRPEKRNALGSDMTPALRDMLLRFDADPRARVVVITGAGKAFCSGGDVSGMGNAPPRASGESDPRPTVQDRIRALQHAQETLTLRLHELSAASARRNVSRLASAPRLSPTRSLPIARRRWPNASLRVRLSRSDT